MIETDRETPGEHGTSFKAPLVCRQCHSILSGGEFGIALACFCGAQEALAMLVELKRLKDSHGSSPEYERRKALAWQEAFRVCGIIQTPKVSPGPMFSSAQLSSAPWRVVSGRENAGKGWPVAFMGDDHKGVAWYIETVGVHASEAVSEPEKDAHAIAEWRNRLAGLP